MVQQVVEFLAQLVQRLKHSLALLELPYPTFRDHYNLIHILAVRNRSKVSWWVSHYTKRCSKYTQNLLLVLYPFSVPINPEM